MRLSDCDAVLKDVRVNATFSRLGFVSHAGGALLTFLEDPAYLAPLRHHPDVAAVISSPELADDVPTGLGLAVSPTPRVTFLQLHNHLAAQGGFYPERGPSQIHPSASIHPSAVVAERGVEIGEGVLVEPRAVLLEGVTCEAGAILRAGTVIGSEGFQFELHEGRILPVTHVGGVRIGRGAEVQSGSVVARAVFGGETVFGPDSRIDGLGFIAHNVQVGARCRIAAGAVVAGSAILEDECWIGPGAVISSGVRIGRGARVSLGSVVNRDVPPGETVTGNFALPHAQFIAHLRSIR